MAPLPPFKKLACYFITEIICFTVPTPPTNPPISLYKCIPTVLFLYHHHPSSYNQIPITTTTNANKQDSNPSLMSALPLDICPKLIHLFL